MSYRVLFRRGTTAGADGTVVLSAGEPAALIDGTDVTLKVGDGVTQFDGLPGLPLDLSTVYQPLDSDLTAIAALSTTSFGRALLEKADADAVVSALSTSLSGSYVAKGTVPVTLVVALSDESTAITTGTAKVTMRMPYAMTLTAVRASLTAVSTSGTPTFDINEGGNSILSTKLTIDANEKTSTTAATPAVISDGALADDAEITFDVDVAGTGAKGAKITLIGTRSVS